MRILCVFSGIISKTDASIIQSLRLSCQGNPLARVGWLTPGGNKSQHSSASAVIAAARDPLTAHGLAPPHASPPHASSPRVRSDGSGVSGPSHHSRRESYFDSVSEPVAAEPVNIATPRSNDSSPDGPSSTSRRRSRPPGRPWVPGKGAELPSWLHILIRKRE